MYKLLVTSWIWSASGVCVHTLTIDFETREMANAAFECIRLEEQKDIRRHVVKLYA